MVTATFTANGSEYKITTYKDGSGSHKRAVVLILHGNFGLSQPYGGQIGLFATALADQGYFVAVPQYYSDDAPHPEDRTPERHLPTLEAAIAAVCADSNSDPGRLALVGFSLGAGIAMAHIGSAPGGSVAAFVDFYGPLPANIAAGAAGFPPTATFHNRLDGIVPFAMTRELFRLLPDRVEHLAIGYVEDRDPYHHAFASGGPADLDSRAKALEWIVRHMPPAEA